MIPYVELQPLKLWGPIVLDPFSILVAIGCVTGVITALWHVTARGLDLQRFSALIAWTLIPAFLISHLVALFFYHPEQLRFDLQLLNVGKGMSSFGGFLGGAVGAAVFLRYYRLPVLEYTDALVLGLAVGWFFGRLGCSIVHDHPGLPSDFILAVQYPTVALLDGLCLD